MLRKKLNNHSRMTQSRLLSFNDRQAELKQLTLDLRSTATGSSGPFRLDLDLDRVKDWVAQKLTAAVVFPWSFRH